jgi:tripartite-type tricarboxylate transporter receptor subunit TctC
MVLSSAKPFVDAGKVRVLGITTRQRVASAPDWPTIAEQGIKDFDASVWTGVYVRKETPRPIVEKLAADVAAVLRDPEIVASFAQLGAEPGTLTLDAFGSYVRTSAEKNGAIIRKLGLAKP